MSHVEFNLSCTSSIGQYIEWDYPAMPEVNLIINAHFREINEDITVKVLYLELATSPTHSCMTSPSCPHIMYQSGQ